MREYSAFSDKANDLLARAKIELGLAQVEQQLQHAYAESVALEWREAKQGTEGAEEDLDSPTTNPKKPMKVVISDDDAFGEEMALKRRLFDSVCRSDLSPTKKEEVFKALTGQ